MKDLINVKLKQVAKSLTIESLAFLDIIPCKY